MRDLLHANRAGLVSRRDGRDRTDRTRGPATRSRRPTRAALWLAALITQALAAATVVPLYLLVRRTHSPTTSWWTAALWPLVPALAIFLPKSDALLPFFGALFLWLWLEGFRRGRLGSVCAGGSRFLAGDVSEPGRSAGRPGRRAAHVVGSRSFAAAKSESRCATRDWAARIAAAAVGWGIPVLLLWLFGRINLLAVWHWNFRNHAAFYDHYTRTYWKWLLANPIELFFAVRRPLIVAAVIGFRKSSRRAGGDGRWVRIGA